jgi:hypothetical protein
MLRASQAIIAHRNVRCASARAGKNGTPHLRLINATTRYRQMNGQSSSLQKAFTVRAFIASHSENKSTILLHVGVDQCI